MFGVHLVPEAPKSYRDWSKANNNIYVDFSMNLLKEGILVEPDSREPWFFCEAHQDIDLNYIEKSIHRSLQLTLDKMKGEVFF